ncbi:MAG: hypothetical protein AAF570_24200 [Bacteroidota bacterium]
MKKTTQFFALSLFAFLMTISSTAMACGYGLYGINPGKSNFENVLASNKYYQHKISTHTEMCFGEDGQHYVTYKTIEFTNFGITLVSQEVKGENFTKSMKNTKLEKVVFDDYNAFRMMAYRINDKASFYLKNEERNMKGIEAKLGEATSKSDAALVYEKIGLKFNFGHGIYQDAGKLTSIEWTA